MESADLANSRLSVPQCTANQSGLRLAIALCVGLFAVGLVFSPRFSAQLLCCCCLVVLLMLWRSHLEKASLPRSWSLTLTVVLAVNLSVFVFGDASAPVQALVGRTALALFVYLLLKNICTAISTLELHEVACAAVALAVGMHSSPPLLLVWVVLGVALWFRCSAKYGGALRAALLIYIPTAIGILIMVVVRKLIPGTYGNVLTMFHVLASSLPLSRDAANLDLQHMFPVLAFSSTVVFTRIAERLAGVGDFAFLALLLFILAVLGVGKLSVLMNSAEVSIFLYAAGMCLLALAPPRRRSSLLFLTFVITTSLIFRMKP